MLESFKRRKSDTKQRRRSSALAAKRRRSSSLFRRLKLEHILKDVSKKQQLRKYLRDHKAEEPLEFSEIVTPMIVQKDLTNFKSLKEYFLPGPGRDVNISENICNMCLFYIDIELNESEKEKVIGLLRRANQEALFFLEVTHLRSFCHDLTVAASQAEINSKEAPLEVADLISKSDKYPTLYVQFENYLCDRFAEESLYFLLHTTPLKKEVQEIKTLRDRYISVDSEMEINIEDNLRFNLLMAVDSVLTDVDNSTEWEKYCALVAEAEKQVLQILQHNFYSEFIKTLNEHVSSLPFKAIMGLKKFQRKLRLR